MIGVAARKDQLDTVEEFFELFKTPWEPLVPGKRYQTVISADGETEPRDTSFALIYGCNEHPLDRRLDVTPSPLGPALVSWRGARLPLFRTAASFSGPIDPGVLAVQGGTVDYRASIGGMRVRRIGYDLFSEVAHLLSVGQPRAYADVPTLELHIAFIRECLRDLQLPFVEIPPRPHGAEYFCCLTHDLDFFGIRRHRVGRTLAGFALRGTVGTVMDTVRGRRPVNEAMRNVLAVLSLPLIFMGLRRDLWEPLRDYAAADRGHASTFFLVPFRDHPGVTPEGGVEPRRAVAYGIQDIKDELQTEAEAPRELAVHGIDAWRDAERGRAERRELTNLTGQRRTGVRMHWLYFSPDAPRHIEAAGFDYDSTFGYNDAVGARAGTMQVFQLPGTERLLELPLTVMDSAMLYADRMGLTHDEAVDCCRSVAEQARRFGGALVVNWHDRSLAPERQWGRCYDELLDAVEATGAWFVTAGQAVDWFRWRRSIRFCLDGASQQIAIAAPELPEGLPPARLAVQRTFSSDETLFAGGTCRFSL